MSNQSSPFDVSQLMAGFDPKELMEKFSKAMGDYQIPGVDVKAIMETQRKNVEALTTANKQALEGMQAVVTRQGEILRQTLDEAATALRDVTSAGSPADAAQKQGELLKKAVEQALANMRELAELATKSNSAAFETINKRINESVEEIKTLAANLKK